MDDQLETGKKTTKADEEFVAPRNDIEQDQTSTETSTEVNDQVESQPEFELTPEIEAMIMGKVQDILKDGTAFHAFNSPTTKEKKVKELCRLFQDGILGTMENITPVNDADPQLSRTSEWVKNLRKSENKAYIHFNIVGRQNEIRSPEQNPIKDSRWSEFRPVLIFDIEDYDELAPNYYFPGTAGDRPGWYRRFSNIGEKEYTFNDKNLIGKRFRSNDPELVEDFMRENPESIIDGKLIKPIEKKNSLHNKKIGDKGLPIPSNEFGFVTANRIPPRRFKGLVVGSNFLTLEETTRAMERSYQNKTSLFIPIYSKEGNLLWPRQMSYEEVKQFVADRDAKGESEEETLDSGSSLPAGR